MAPSTTCAFVRISPSVEMITPVPSEVPPSTSALIVTTVGATYSATATTSSRDLDDVAGFGNRERFVGATSRRLVEPARELIAEQGAGESGNPRNGGDDCDEEESSTPDLRAGRRRRQRRGTRRRRRQHQRRSGPFVLGHGSCLSVTSPVRCEIARVHICFTTRRRTRGQLHDTSNVIGTVWSSGAATPLRSLIGPPPVKRVSVML